MIEGHGDDAGRWGGIAVDFASNVRRCDHSALWEYLRVQLPALCSYPESDGRTAEAAIAAYHGVRREEVLLTAGATGAIYMIAQSLRGSKSYVYEPTFSEYGDACRLHGHVMASEVEAEMAWLCVPNNPTGAVADERAMMADREKLWVIDHSYAAFTSSPLLSVREAVAAGNVLIVNSLTKRFGLPGLRMGYVVGSAGLIARLRAQRQPWAVSALAQVAVPWLLAHESLYAIDTAAIDTERARVVKALQAMGIMVTPSECHILLCRWPHGTAAELKERLANEYGLLIRDASNFEGLSDHHFRIALQGRQADDRLIKALRELSAQQ